VSVYTQVAPEEIQPLLDAHGLGQCQSLKGIAAGIENSNYFLSTTKGEYVLTLFERADPEALPCYLKLMAAAAHDGIPCPDPVTPLTTLAGRPAVIITRLSGGTVDAPTPEQSFQTGAWLARLHLALAAPELGRGLPPSHDRALVRERFERNLDKAKVHAEWGGLVPLWQGWVERFMTIPAGLPGGVIHGDLFTDNVLFDGGRLSGLIDFYYACSDAWVLDLAITMNAWPHAEAVAEGYRSVRALHETEEAALHPCRIFAALRFMISRLDDALNPREGEMVQIKDPLEYHRKVANLLGESAGL